jgi:hypothetical protein
MMAHHIVARIQGMVPDLEPRHLRSELDPDVHHHARRRYLRRPIRRRAQER